MPRKNKELVTAAEAAAPLPQGNNPGKKSGNTHTYPPNYIAINISQASPLAMDRAAGPSLPGHEKQHDPSMPSIRVVGLPVNRDNMEEGFKTRAVTNETVTLLDGDEEDPFTLEPFHEIMDTHLAAGKAFILARVTTVDPDTPSKEYHSYYAAHHINKVIFRTQPEEGLLHRMKAKNPLNNMVIIGDVYYYVIEPSQVMQSRRQQLTSPKSTTSASSTSSVVRTITSTASLLLHSVMSGDGSRSGSPLLRDDHAAATFHTSKTPPALSITTLTNEEQQQPLSPPVDLADRVGRKKLVLYMKQNDDASGKSAPIDHSEPRKYRLRSISFSNDSHAQRDLQEWVGLHKDRLFSGNVPAAGETSPTRRRSPRLVVNTPTQTSPKAETNEYVARFYGTDDDFLMNAEVRAFFKANAMDPNDAVLFELQRPGVNAPGGVLDNMQQHPALHNFLYSVEGGENRRSRKARLVAIGYLLAFAIALRVTANGRPSAEIAAYVMMGVGVGLLFAVWYS